MLIRKNKAAVLSAVTLALNAGVSQPATARNLCSNDTNFSACTIVPGVTIAGTVVTYGTEFKITNHGFVVSAIITRGIRSNIINTGRTGIFLLTYGDNSSVVNSGDVGVGILTFGASSGIVNTGLGGSVVSTAGKYSPIFNSGYVGSWLETKGDNSDVINTGSIGRVSTRGSDSKIFNHGSVATGITTRGANADITNSGTAQTITTDGDHSSVTNFGSVGAGSTADGIYITGLDPTLTLLSGSVIQGALDLSGAGTRTLNIGPGLSIAYTFDNGPSVINTEGAPYAHVGNQVVVVDKAGTAPLGQTDDMLADLTGGVFNAVHSRLSHSGSRHQSASVTSVMGGKMSLGMPVSPLDDTPASPSVSYKATAWGQAFGAYSRQKIGSANATAVHNFSGGIMGIDRWVAPGLRIGGFGGGTQGDLKTPFNVHDVDTESYFGGAYASFTRRDWFARVLITAGRSTYESERDVANNLVTGGMQTASASYGGTFVSPELAIGTSWTLGRFAIEPSARVRYAHMSLGGYTETGALGNFTVADRDVSLWLGRAQLAVPIATDWGTFAPRIGIEAWSSDNGAISASLLGQAVSFDPGGSDHEATGFVGSTTTAKLAGNVSLFFDNEVHFAGHGLARAESRASLKIRF